MSGLCLDRPIEEARAEYDEVCSEIALLEQTGEDPELLAELRLEADDLASEISYIEDHA